MKRILSLSVAFMMLFTMLPANAAVEKADGGTNVLKTFNLKNGNAVYQDSKTGYYVARTAKYKFFESAYWAEQNELGKPNCYTTKDYIKFYDDGTLTEEKKESFRIKYSTYEKNESGAWVKVQKTLPDEDTFTNEGWALDVPESAPEEFTFSKVSEDGKVYHYSVLDSEDGGYLIYCNDGYGSLTMNSVPKNNVFDPTPSEGNTNIATFLNGDFYNGTSETGSLSGNYSAYTALDTTVKDYIIEHTFIQAGNNQGAREDRDLTANSKTDYKVNCRIALISYADYIKYAGKIGYKSENTTRNGQILLRDCGNNSWNCVPLLNEANGNILGHTGAGQNVNSKNYTVYGETPVYFRPLFWVSKDYFKNVKLDSYGAEVKAILKGVCTETELSQIGYSEQEIDEILGEYSSELAAENVTLSGGTAPGRTLVLNYDLSEQCSSELTTVKWFAADSENAAGVLIAEGENSLKVINAYGGKYIRAEVTPKAENRRYGDKVAKTVLIENAKAAFSAENAVGRRNDDTNYSFKTEAGYRYVMLSEDADAETVYVAGEPMRIEEITSAQNAYFSAETNAFARWLGGGFLSGTKIDSTLPQYIVESEYLTEGSGEEGTETENDYFETMSVSIPAYWEIEESGRLGFAEGAVGSVLMRTPGGSNSAFACYSAENGKLSSVSSESLAGLYTRPAFKLSKNFFREHKLDYSSMGDGIKEMFEASFTRDELRETGYTESELSTIFSYYDETLKADKIKVGGTAKPSGELFVSEYETSRAANLERSVISWYQRESANAAPYLIAENTKTLKVTSDMVGKYISASVILKASDGAYGPEIVGTDSVKIEAGMQAYKTGKLSRQLDNPDYVFTSGGGSYCLAEDMADGAYIVAQTSFRMGNATDRTVIDNYFDPSSNSIAAWLNTDCLTNGYIKANIVPYLVENDFLTEGSGVEGRAKSDYVLRYKVSTIADYEFEKYADRVGYCNTGTTHMVVMRTPDKTTTNLAYFRESDGAKYAKGVAGTTITNNHDYSIRPVMVISYDFFKNNKIEVDMMGSGVKEMLRNKLSKTELSKLYDETELADIYGEELSGEVDLIESKAELSGLSLSGFVNIGGSVTVECEAKNDGYDISYSWFVSENGETYERINGETSKTFNIPYSYKGKYLKAEVSLKHAESGIYGKTYSVLAGIVGSEKELGAVGTIENSGSGFSFKAKIVNQTDSAKDIEIMIMAFDGQNNMLDKQIVLVSADSGIRNFETPSLNVSGAAFYRAVARDAAGLLPLCGITVNN